MDPTYVHLCIKVVPKLCKSVISGVYSAGIYTVHARKWNALASFESVREKPACWLSIGGATEWIRDLQLAIQYHSVVQPFIECLRNLYKYVENQKFHKIARLLRFDS